MEVLLQMKVISEGAERNKELFYNGERSTEPFQMEPGDVECGFDMGGVYAGPGFTIAPEEYVDGVSCPKCNADITEQWAQKSGMRTGARSMTLRTFASPVPNAARFAGSMK